MNSDGILVFTGRRGYSCKHFSSIAELYSCLKYVYYIHYSEIHSLCNHNASRFLLSVIQNVKMDYVFL